MVNSDVFWHHYGRIFAVIEARQLQKCFLEWIKTIVQTISVKVIAIDGKTVQRAFDGIDFDYHKTFDRSAFPRYRLNNLFGMRVHRLASPAAALPKYSRSLSYA